MDIHKIPLELRLRPQWVSFQIGPGTNGNGKLKKVPLIPGTSIKASPTDPSTWRTFEEAVAGGNPAYCFTKEDGIIFIDFDKKVQEKVLDQLMEAFEGTYMELSQSQTGVHILVRGTMLSDTGYNRQALGIEMYAHSRFCIFTGMLIEEQGTIGDDYQEVVRKLEEDLISHGSSIPVPDMEEKPERNKDEEVLQQCRERSEKFQPLWEGKWEGEYPSQSEADHALIGFLVYATLSNEQVKRLFKQSGLFRPDKPHKLKYSLQVLRGKQQQEAEIDKFTEQLLTSRNAKLAIQEPVSWDQNDSRLYRDIPEGLLREFFEAFQRWPRYPLKEASLMAAIITALALFSRRYQSHTHLALNMWLFLVGESSAGKEMIRKGPNALFKAANAPMNGVFGGEIRSSPGVEDALRGSLRHLAYHKECHTWLEGLCNPRSSPGWHQTRSKIMDTYTAGADTWLVRQVKVGKGEQKEYELDRPCLTIFGDCVTERFYEAVGTAQISDGFLPRCLVLEVDQESISEDPNVRQPFDAKLLDRVNKLAMEAMEADIGGLGMSKPAVIVPIMPDAEKAYDTLAREIRTKLKANKNDPHNALRGKVEEKVNKLMTLCGICRDPDNPRVTLPDVEWASMFVRITDGRMAHNLASGEHDPAMHQQRKVIQNKLDLARVMGPADRKRMRYFTCEKLLTEPDLIPWGWLREQAGRLACFRNDRRGIQVALTNVLKDLEASGEVTLFEGRMAFEKFGARSAVILNCRDVYPADPLF